MLAEYIMSLIDDNVMRNIMINLRGSFISNGITDVKQTNSDEMDKTKDTRMVEEALVCEYY